MRLPRSSAILIYLVAAAALLQMENRPSAAEPFPPVELDYEALYRDGRSVREFIEENLVYGDYSEQIGNVEDIIFSADGRALSVVAEVGGAWDIGDVHVNVPWDRIILDNPRDGIYGIIIPVTEETIEEYALFSDEVVTAFEAANDIETVDEGFATGPRAWRATELIGTHVRLRDGDAYVNYGSVRDLIIDDGEIKAVVVGPDVTYGARGPYAFPFNPHAWDPRLGSYELPHALADVPGLTPFDYDRLGEE